MKLVIFDFDGVLVNTTELIFKILKDENGNLTLDLFKDFSNGNIHNTIGDAIKNNNFSKPDDYHELYDDGLSTINIHDILRDTILKLKDNYKLSIISSSWGDIISSFLKKENLTNYFDDILGFDIHTSKVVKIKSLLEKYNVLPKDAVFITDSLGDILESNECDVKSIGVTWGLHDKKTLEKGNPVAIIDDPRELLKTIESVL